MDLPAGLTYDTNTGWGNAVLTNAHVGVHTLRVRMQYQAGPAASAPTRKRIQNFQFTVLSDEASFVNGPFTTPIEVPENTRAVGDISLFDIRFPPGVTFENRVRLSGADANVFTARISFIITPDETTTAHIELVFKNAPNFEDPQGGPSNDSNDYQVNLTVGAVGRDLTVRVTDATEPPREFVLRPLRVTPTSITIGWYEPVNTGPPILDYQFRLFRPLTGTGGFDLVDKDLRTFKYSGLTPNAEYEITARVITAEGSSTSNLVRVTTPHPLVPAFAADATIPNQLYLVGRQIRPLTLPQATGGNGRALTYALTGPNGETVPGLTFNPATRVLGGRPTAASQATSYTYTAMDADDNTGADDAATLAFSITVEVDSAPRFSRRQPGLPFLRNEFGRRALPEAVGGNGALTYALLPAGALPAGLTYDGTTRPPTISGRPTRLFAKSQFTYTVADADANIAGSDGDTQSFNIAVVNSFPEFFEPVADQRLSENAPFNLVLPDAADGTTPRTFTLTGPNGVPVSEAVPGMGFLPDVRFLIGRPTAPGTTTLTYTVTDFNEATDTISFRVIVSPRVALDALETPGDQTYTMDTEIPALTLPAGSSGTGTLTYTLRVGPFEHDDVDATDNAVPGLLFDRTTRVLTGTPTEVTDGAVTLIYVARDINNGTAPLTFDITVAEAVMVEVPDDQFYTMGTTVTDLTLPVATGGTGDLTYALTGADNAALSVAVPGLTFNTTSRVLSGTPTTAATTALTYTVTDQNGSTASDTMTLTVATQVAVTAPGDQTYTMDTMIPALTLPMATGGTGTLTYTLTGASDAALSVAVPGLTFNTTSRVLSGTPTTAGATELTYTVTDQNGSTASATVTLTVATQVAVTAPNDQTYTMGAMIPALTLPMATGGTGTLTYTLTGPNGTNLSELPAGLMWTGDTTNPGTITGEPTATTASPVTLTYTVTDQNGSTASDTFTVAVVTGVALNAPNNQTYTMGRPITDLTLPAASGGTGTLTYTLQDAGGNDVDATDNAVPGLTFNTTSRVLSGTPTTQATTALTYTVTDQNNSTASATFSLTVADGVALNAPGDQTYTMGTTITALTLQAATGGTAPLTYTLTGPSDAALSQAVPGLTFNTTARVLSGTPTTQATTALTYTVTDEHGSTTSATFDITVAAAVALADTGDQTYTMGRPITGLTLPMATGGTGTLTYTLTGPGDAALSQAVPGLTFTATTRVLSGTPTTAATIALTYTVTDEHDSTASDSFDITVADGVALNAPTDQTYTMGTTITALTLPAGTGGTGTLTYTLTGPANEALSQAVPGLTFTATTRVLSGTPTTAAITALTYTVTDDNGSTASATFSITVAAQVTLNAPNGQTYTMGRPIPTLTLSAATGGTGTLTYTLTGPSSGPLPTGLTFDDTATARTLTGTPTTAATTALTYTVTDEHGSTASATFTLTVAAAVTLADTDDQTYTMGTTITPLTLPAATGGTGTLTYTLTGPSSGPLPTGLTFDDTATARTLTGTPTTAATIALTYTVTDQNGSTASDTFTVTVAEAVMVSSPGDQRYTMGTMIPALTLPTATGGTGDLTYTLRDGTGNDVDTTDNAVPGLTFTATTRVLSGTPTTAATTALTYTVTDEHGSTAMDTFTVTVATGVALNDPNDQTYTMGTMIPALTLPAATGGTGTLTYTLTGPSSGPLPTGLTFDTSSRTLSGTPTTVATTPLTYTVTDQNGSTASATFSITVAVRVALNAPSDQTYTMGTMIPALTLPPATGGTGTLTYTLRDGSGNDVDATDNAVPGLTFDDTATSRILSGTPTAAATTALTYTVTDQNGSTASDTVTLTVAAQVALTAPGDQTYTQGTAVTPLTLPTATGGTGTLTYTLTGPSNGALPTGLTFDGTARTLSGTPTTAAATELTYTATDINGSTSTDIFTVTVVDGVALNVPGDQTYTMGTAITPLTLPPATGGTGTLTYTLRDGSGNDVDAVDNAVPGLTFNTTTRVLSGTPTTAATTALTYTVADQNSSTASDTLTLTVAAGVALNAPNDQTYTMGRPIPALTLPAATGGTGTLTYTLTGPARAALSQAVPGLIFNATSRTLTGTPTTAATTVLTYTVTDDNGSTASDTLTLTVAAQMTLNTPNDQTYTVGTTIPALTLPPATGGTGTLTYTLRDTGGNDVDTTDNAVPGLAFNTTARTLTGTPITAAITTLTYTVTDENGSTASDTFALTVTAGVARPALGDQTYTVGTEIPDLTLPAATGGTGTLTYTLRDGIGNDVDTTDNAVPGLIFNATARTLTGTPTTAATTVLTYTATDQNGSTASDTFTLTVAAAVALTDTGDQTYTVGTEIPALTLPAATSGTGTLTYTLRDAGGNDVDAVDNAVPGLTFTATTRVLSGTPTTQAITTLTYTVTDENGSTASDTFTLTVAAGVALTDTGDQTYTVGRPIPALTLPAATGGTGTLTYTLRDAGGNDVDAVDNAVPGLTFTATTRVLSGTPTTQATTALTYTVTDENGSTALDTFTLTVATGVALNTPIDQTYTVGRPIPALTLPPATGGTGTLTYTLRDAGGNDVDAVDNAVPGLTFTATTRVLSGTPTTQATTVLTYTVTDQNGSTASDAFTLTVATGVALNAPSDQTYTMGAMIPALTLPMATGGTGTLTYTLRDGNGNDVDTTDNAVPGLTFTATTRILSGTPTTATTTALTYTVTDQNGSTASAGFSITVNEAEVPDTAPAFAVTSIADQTYTVDAAITPLTLSLATGGNGAITYILTGPNGTDVSELLDGLSFDAATRTITGTPTAATAPLAFTWTAADADDNTATDDADTLDFSITVNEAQAPNTAPTFAAGAGINDQIYTIGIEIPDLTLPMATGGDGATTYALTPLDELPDGLSFDGTASPPTLTGTPTTTTPATMFTYTARNSGANNMPTDTVALDFQITVNAAGTFTALNKIILPEVARNMADSTVSSIARRVEQAKRASREAGLNLAGQSMSGQDNLAAALRTHGEAKRENSSDFKELLTGSDFVLPLNPSDGAGINATSLALWGRGEYRDLSGERDGLSWEAGDLTGAHVGVDVRLGEDIVAGAAISRLESNLRYTGYDDGAGGPDEGAYKLAITSAHPYIGWRAGEVDLWATVGYGEGELAITPQEQARQSSDVKLRTFGIGGNGEVWQGGPSSFRLKGEALRTALKVDGHAEAGAAIERMDVAATRLRLTIEGRQSATLANGGVFEPVLEMGVRYDSGDGETSGAEVGGGWRYHNPATRFTADGRLRALLGRSNYEEWGVQGSMALQPGADGQGVSFSLSPGYGDSSSGIQQLWRHGLAADADDGAADDTDNYAMKLDARIGYGHRLSCCFSPGEHHGVLTPYGEMTRGTTDSYRMGVNWKAGTRFDLTLLGERREPTTDPAEHAVLLKGEVRF